MNAGRDVERMVSDWFVLEAAARAPDRVVHETRRLVNSTGQRRFLAAWREPMYLSPMKLAGMAAVLVVALGAGVLIGRATVPSGVGSAPSPLPTETAAPTDDTAAYRNARDEICTRYVAATDPLRPKYDGLYDTTITDAERGKRILALDQFVSQYDAMREELSKLDAPAAIAEEHAANLALYDAQAGMIHAVVTRLYAGDLAGAESIDLATDPISRKIETFETRNVLTHCP